MTLEEIADAAVRAGLLLEHDAAAMTLSWSSERPGPDYFERLMEFAALVADAEREACAEVAEQTVCDTHLPTGVTIYGGRAAKAIRARMEKQ